MNENRLLARALILSMLLHLLLFLVIKSGKVEEAQMEVFVPVRLLEEADALTLPATGENPAAAKTEPMAVTEAPAEVAKAGPDSRPALSAEPRPRPQAAAAAVRPAPAAAGSRNSDRPAAGATEGSKGGPGLGDTGSPGVFSRSRPPGIPKSLQNQGVTEARVRLRVFVLKDGTVGDAVIASGSGYDRIDSLALSSVRKWQFKARIRDGEAVEDWLEVTVDF